MLTEVQIGRLPRGRCSLGEHSHSSSRQAGRNIPPKSPSRFSKLNVTDAYHRDTLWQSQVSVFAYIFPSAPDNSCIIICINLVLPMVWVDSLNFFCAFSETLTDAVNALVYTELPVLAYGTIYKIPITPPTHTHMQEPRPYWLLYG